MALGGSLSCFLLLAFLYLCLGPCVHGAFEGHTLMTVTPNRQEHIAFLNTLADDFVDLDFWQTPTINRTAHLLVPPGLTSLAQDKLTKSSVPWVTVPVDVAGMVAASTAKNRNVRSSGIMDVVDHHNYHTYSQIEEYLIQLQVKYSDNMEVMSLKYVTHEGRKVMAVKLHGSSGKNKPSVILEAGIHAREWVSPASCLYVIEKLLQAYKLEESEAKHALDTYDWYFVPVTNPDGYDFTHTDPENRFWRKNRRRSGKRCVGVDLNRNFDVMFGTTGVSFRCDSDIYPGNHGFSEPETANIRELVYELQPTLISYLSVHSYSQLLLVPWGYYEGVLRPDNHQELDRVANIMSDAILATDRKTYRVGTAYKLLNYAASGASEDWALSYKPGIYAYCYELRPEETDSRGFLLPPNEIVPTGRELLASLYTLALEMRQP